MPAAGARQRSPAASEAGPPVGEADTEAWCSCFDQDVCMHCGQEDWEPGHNPMTILICSCCGVRGMHIKCHTANMPGAANLLQEVQQDPRMPVMCSEECSKIYEEWGKCTGQRKQVPNESQEFTLEVVQYNKGDKSSKSTVNQAIKIFRSSFRELIMPNGRDLIEMVAQGYETPDVPDKANNKDSSKPKKHSANSDDDDDDDDDEDPEYSFGEFRVLVLRKGGTIVTVATLRIFGRHFAEVPFIATRDGYRREGHCKRLIKAVDDLLQPLGVKYLVLPALKGDPLNIWTKHFGFRPVSPMELKRLMSVDIVDMDQESVVHVKREVGTPLPIPPSASRSANRTVAATRRQAAAAQPSTSQGSSKATTSTQKGGAESAAAKLPRPPAPPPAAAAAKPQAVQRPAAAPSSSAPAASKAPPSQAVGKAPRTTTTKAPATKAAAGAKAQGSEDGEGVDSESSSDDDEGGSSDSDPEFTGRGEGRGGKGSAAQAEESEDSGSEEVDLEDEDEGGVRVRGHRGRGSAGGTKRARSASADASAPPAARRQRITPPAGVVPPVAYTAPAPGAAAAAAAAGAGGGEAQQAGTGAGRPKPPAPGLVLSFKWATAKYHGQAIKLGDGTTRRLVTGWSEGIRPEGYEPHAGMAAVAAQLGGKPQPGMAAVVGPGQPAKSGQLSMAWVEKEGFRPDRGEGSAVINVPEAEEYCRAALAAPTLELLAALEQAKADIETDRASYAASCAPGGGVWVRSSSAAAYVSRPPPGPAGPSNNPSRRRAAPRQQRPGAAPRPKPAAGGCGHARRQAKRRGARKPRSKDKMRMHRFTSLLKKKRRAQIDAQLALGIAEAVIQSMEVQKRDAQLLVKYQELASFSAMQTRTAQALYRQLLAHGITPESNPATAIDVYDLRCPELGLGLLRTADASAPAAAPVDRSGPAPSPEVPQGTPGGSGPAVQAHQDTGLASAPSASGQSQDQAWRDADAGGAPVPADTGPAPAPAAAVTDTEVTLPASPRDVDLVDAVLQDLSCGVSAPQSHPQRDEVQPAPEHASATSGAQQVAHDMTEGVLEDMQPLPMDVDPQPPYCPELQLPVAPKPQDVAPLPAPTVPQAPVAAPCDSTTHIPVALAGAVAGGVALPPRPRSLMAAPPTAPAAAPLMETEATGLESEQSPGAAATLALRAPAALVSKVGSPLGSWAQPAGAGEGAALPVPPSPRRSPSYMGRAPLGSGMTAAASPETGLLNGWVLLSPGADTRPPQQAQQPSSDGGHKQVPPLEGSGTAAGAPAFSQAAVSHPLQDASSCISQGVDPGNANTQPATSASLPSVAEPTGGSCNTSGTPGVQPTGNAASDQIHAVPLPGQLARTGETHMQSGEGSAGGQVAAAADSQTTQHTVEEPSEQTLAAEQPTEAGANSSAGTGSGTAAPNVSVSQSPQRPPGPPPKAPGTEPPLPSPVFASPGTLRNFDEQCLTRLLPGVVGVLMESPPTPEDLLALLNRSGGNNEGTPKGASSAGAAGGQSSVPAAESGIDISRSISTELTAGAEGLTTVAGGSTAVTDGGLTQPVILTAKPPRSGGSSAAKKRRSGGGTTASSSSGGSTSSVKASQSAKENAQVNAATAKQDSRSSSATSQAHSSGQKQQQQQPVYHLLSSILLSSADNSSSPSLSGQVFGLDLAAQQLAPGKTQDPAPQAASALQQQAIAAAPGPMRQEPSRRSSSGKSISGKAPSAAGSATPSKGKGLLAPRLQLQAAAGTPSRDGAAAPGGLLSVDASANVPVAPGQQLHAAAPPPGRDGAAGRDAGPGVPAGLLSVFDGNVDAPTPGVSKIKGSSSSPQEPDSGVGAAAGVDAKVAAIAGLDASAADPPTGRIALLFSQDPDVMDEPGALGSSLQNTADEAQHRSSRHGPGGAPVAEAASGKPERQYVEEPQDPFALLGLASEASQMEDGDGATSDGNGSGGEGRGEQKSSVCTVQVGREAGCEGEDDDEEQDGLSPADMEELGRTVSMMEPLLG